MHSKGLVFVPVLLVAIGLSLYQSGCHSRPPATTTEPEPQAAPPATQPQQPVATPAPAPEPPPPPLPEPVTVEPEPMPAVELVLRTIYFEFDQSRLTSQATEIMAQNARVLRTYPRIRLQIEGHCDERGTTEYNLALGQRRADTVRRYLVNAGITPNRLSTISYGEERPVDPASNETAWARNRRAEFKILE